MFLILDGNNLAWAGYYGLERAMKPEDDERKQRVATLGLGGSLLGAIARAGVPPGVTASHKLERVAVCFDEGRPLRRRKTFPPYQTGRENDPKFIQNEPTILGAIADFCKGAAPHLPIEIVRGKNTEADDLVAGLVQANPKSRIRIVSTDRDFLQLIGPNLDVYAPVRKLIIDESNLFDVMAPKTSTGKSVLFPRERFLDYRALIGDTSDDLPGVPGVGPLSAAKLLAAAPLDSYFAPDTHPVRAPGVRTALERKSDAIERAFADGSAREIVERNRALMDLRRPSPCWDELDKLTARGRWDRDRFGAWFSEQRFAGVDEKQLTARMEELAGVS
jgi:5'-3' exonuclease